MIAALFRFLQRHATGIMASCLFVGLAFQDLAAALRPLVFPFAVATMLLAVVRLEWRALLVHLRRPGLALTVAIATLTLAPAAVALLIRPLGLPPGLENGIVLVAAAPPVSSAPAYAIFIGLDAALAMVAALPATLLSPLVVPPVLLWALGLDIEIGLADFAWRLAIMVGLSFGGAILIRCLYRQAEVDERAHFFDGGVVLCIATFGIGVMDGITPVILSDPAKALLYAGAAMLANAGLQVAGALLAWRLPRREALTVGLLAGNRNVILVLAAVAPAAAPDVVLYMIAAQLPLYVMPAIMRPVCRRLMRSGLNPGH